MITIQDIKPILPRYADNSGVNCCVTIANTESEALRHCYRLFDSLSQEELAYEVILVEPYKILANGENSGCLHVIAKERFV
jgi:hypothetical protein